MDTETYRSIIALPHHKSDTKAAMPLYNRAAQFAPFAALSGYDGVIRETARQTQTQTELCEDRKEELNTCLQQLAADLDSAPQVSITYYVPDKYKKGGEYRTVQGGIRRIDTLRRELLLADGTRISIDTISDISSALCDKI